MKHIGIDTFATSTNGITPVGLERCPVMGISVVNEEKQSVIRRLLTGTCGKRFFFLNAHCVNESRRSAAYADALKRADAVLPDGIGVELAAAMAGEKIKENLNGTDFVPALLAQAAGKGMSVFLFGGAAGTAEAAANKLVTKYPGLRIAGVRDGFEEARDTAEVIHDINASQADIVLVALGVPKQELWIDAHADKLSAKLVFGVGALFDFLAGNVARAPKLVRRARMEWAWRLAMEPRRLARRYLLGNGLFLARAASHAAGQISATDVSKRALDLAVGTIALVGLAPVFLGTAAAIRLTSKGPVFFRQTRVGINGKEFSMLKFRSMHVDAEARRAELLKTSDRDGLCFKSRRDPRVTAVGRVLRRCSIDELPQILNVLKGEMSLVGPRPALPEEVAGYDLRALGRLRAKPGITGIWQVSGRADIGFEKMIDMDLAYVRSRSLLLDTLLIALTFRAVLSGRGAY